VNRRWKSQVEAREKEAPSKAPTARVATAIDLTRVFFQFTDSEDLDPTYEENSEETIPTSPVLVSRQSRRFVRTRSSRNLVFPVP
jgi:hypothetical protein